MSSRSHPQCRAARLHGTALPFALALALPLAAPAQQADTAARVLPYRAPAIALVQPAAGGSVPLDRPVVLFRFAAGEPSDPLDAASFGVWVDGRDRTAAFQVGAYEAWGPLVGAPDGPGASSPTATSSAQPATPPNDALAPGVHQVTARICSVRGACASTAAAVTVREPEGAPASTPDSTPATAQRRPTRRGAIARAVLEAIQRILFP